MPVIEASVYTEFILTVAAVILTLVVVVYAGFHRKINGALHLAILSSLGTIWGVIYLIELLTKDIERKALLDNLQYIPVGFLPPVFFVVTMVFTGRAAVLHKPQLALMIFVIPVMNIFIIATSKHHQLFQLTAGGHDGSLIPPEHLHGPWFWVLVAHGFIMMFAAVALLLFSHLRAPHWARARLGVLLLASLVITAAAILSLPMWMENFTDLITLTALLIAIIVITYGLLGNRLLHAIPLAASTLLSQLSDAVIILNAHGEILDLNPAAANIPSLLLKEKIGQSFPEVIKTGAGINLGADWISTYPHEIALGQSSDLHAYDMRISPLIEAGDTAAGSMVVLRDITLRKREEVEKAQFENRYRAIFENTSYGILLLDSQGRIIDSNEQFVLLSGYTPDLLRAYRLKEIISLAPDLAEISVDGARDDPFAYQEAALLLANGDYLPVEMNITPISAAGGTAYFVTLQDIRDRKRAETATRSALENAQLRADELATLRVMGEALNQATSLRHALLPVFATVRDVTKSSSIWLYLLGSGPSGHQRYEYHPREAINQLSSEYMHSRVPKCLSRLLEDSLIGPREITDCRCSTLTSEGKHYAFPLYISNRPLGILNFIEEPGSPVNENKLKLLQTICDSLAVAVERVRLFKSEHDQRKLAETMRDIGTALTTSLDINEILDLLLDQLSRLIPYDGGNVMLVEDGEVVIARSRGYELSQKKNAAHLKGLRFKIQTTPNLERLFATQMPVIIPNTAQEKTFVPTSVSPDYHAWLGAPVITDGQVNAVFSLDKVEAGFYTDEHARLLGAYAAQASLAIKNARLYSAEKRRIKELDGLRATLTDITQQLDVNTLLKEIVKRAMRLLSGEVGELGLYDPETRLVRIVVSENFKPDTMGLVVRRGEGLMGRVVKTKKAVAVPDYSLWGGRLLEYEDQRLYSALAVPMLSAEGEVLGVLAVGFTSHEHRFSENDTRLINLFAQQATVALRNARLYEEARRRAEEAETIREAGAAVVSTLNQEKAIELILQQLVQVVPYDSASVLLYNKGKLKIVGGHGFKDIRAVLGMEFALDRNNPGAVVFLEKKPLILTNIPEQVPHFNHLTGHNHIICSWLCVPLVIQNQAIGVLALDGHSVNQFNKEHERLVIAFADQVAIALENARLYENALQSASRFEILYKVSQLISANIRSEAIYPAIHEATSELMETEFFSISLVKEKEGLIEDVYMVDSGKPGELSSRPLDQGLFGKVLKTGQSIHFNTFEESMLEETGAILFGDSEEEQISQSILVVPLKIGVRLVGVISTQTYKPYAYSETDLELLELLGANAAIAIENARLFDAVQELAVTDPLTGLFNRRKLIELGESEFTRSIRYERELSAVMLDCDYFKRVNDTYGHVVGDQVLRRLAELCTSCLRSSDILARYGGDEFMILMPETAATSAFKAAERLRRIVSSTSFETNAGPLTFSVSVGVATLNKSCKSLEQLLERADFASYVSKDAGGNRVTRWTASISRKG